MTRRPLLLSLSQFTFLADPQRNTQLNPFPYLILCLLLVAGCGGGGGKSSPTEPTPPPTPTVVSSFESGSVTRTDPGTLEYVVGTMIDVKFSLKTKTDARVDVWFFGGSGELLGASMNSLRIPPTFEDGKGGVYTEYHHTAKAAFPGTVREVRVVLTEGTGETKAGRPDLFQIVEKK